MVSNTFFGVPPLFSNLSKILSGDIDFSHPGIEDHSVDGSPYSVRPQTVIYPKNTTDIKHVISFSREYQMPLAVRGGGSAHTGGSLSDGLILDMTRYFTRIRQVNMMEHTITVDAGVTLDELQEKLSTWNMEIPPLRGRYGKATVGGFVSTKSATAASFYSGSVREWVEGMTIVVDTGEEHHIKDGITPSGRLLGIYQAVFPLLSEHGPTLRAARRDGSDDATGYYLWSTSIGPRQLLDELVGSEGTLGIITSVTFRVTIAKNFSSTLLLPLTTELLSSSIDIAKHHRAEALYMFDTTYRKLLQKLYPGKLPDTLEETSFYLMVTFRDNNEQTLTSRVNLFLRAASQELTSHTIGEKDALSLSDSELVHDALRAYSHGNHVVATVGEGIVVPKHSYTACMRLLDEELGKTGLLYVLTGYPGSGHVSVSTLMDPRSPSYEKDFFHYNENICSMVKNFEGGLSAVAGDGLEKSAYLGYVYNEATLKVFSLIKKAWDPLAIFNPGKKTSLPLDYLRNHLRTNA